MGNINKLTQLYNDLKNSEISLSEIIRDYRKLGKNMVNDPKYSKYNSDFQGLDDYIKEVFGISLKKLAKNEKDARKERMKKNNKTIIVKTSASKKPETKRKNDPGNQRSRVSKVTQKKREKVAKTAETPETAIPSLNEAIKLVEGGER